MEENKESTIGNSDYKRKMKDFFDWLREKQARDILALDVKHINSVTEGVLIASAVNARHARSLADWILEKMAEAGLEFLGMEGYRQGSWILIDCNDLVLNIFREDERKFYNLEGLWSDAPEIRMQDEETRAGT
ncbi:MAG: ribosome silencing factor [Desulfohalobiaceae bacterium]|nr:ribosome silencing factor [Desulfohalobiaceae bacterium]